MKKNSRNIGLVMFALFPVVINFVFLFIAVKKYSYVPFSFWDCVINSIVILYCVIIIYFSHNRRVLKNTALVFYFLFFSTVFSGFATSFFDPCYPWPPKMKRVCTLAEGIIPGFCGTTEFSVNRYGLRGKDVKLDDPELKILIVGGSSAECMYVTDKASWPWLLQEKLCRITGKMVFVGNAGKSGATTFDHVDLLRDYKYAGKFDWVIVLCGVNDMGRLLHNDREYFLRAKHPGAFNKFFHGVYYKNKLFLVLKSCYLNRAALSAFQDKNGLWILEHRNLRKNALKNRTIADLPLNLSFALSIYKYNLNRIIDICFAKQQKILFITQPAMWKNGLTAPFENLLWERVDNDSAYAAGTLSDILNYYNGAIIDICKERGVPFFDLSSMFAKNGSVFYDDCHFNVMGCEIVADLVAKEMANRIEFQTDKT